jgi:hypothetical protein
MGVLLLDPQVRWLIVLVDNARTVQVRPVCHSSSSSTAHDRSEDMLTCSQVVVEQPSGLSRVRLVNERTALRCAVVVVCVTHRRSNVRTPSGFG